MINKENQDLIDEIIARIRRVAKPERIILFGSAVRGERGKNSDMDFLVVQDGVHRRHLAQKIRQEMLGLEVSVDIVVVTPKDLERYGDSPATVIHPALKEGRVVYGTAA